MHFLIFVDYCNLITQCYCDYTEGEPRSLHKLLTDNEVDSYDFYFIEGSLFVPLNGILIYQGFTK